MKKFTIAILLIAAILMTSVPVKVQAATGWQFIDGYWYYYYDDTTYAVNVTTSPEDNGKLFRFDEYGRMMTGWLRYDVAGEVKWRYANGNGVIQKYWQKINGKWYYFDPSDCFMLSNWYGEINGKYYFFNKNGSMGTGWCKYDDDYLTVLWYYADSSGALMKGWQKINGKWYYLDKDIHVMHSGGPNGGVNYIEGKFYFLESSGAMKTGWCKTSHFYSGEDHVEWYYANDNGELAKGWKKINGKWYYFYPGNDFRMNTETFYELDGKMYYFDTSGAMKTGWIKHVIDSNHYVWFYSYSDGALRSGWEKINGKWYYFDPENYVMVSGLPRIIDGDAYYFSDSGAMMYGWCNHKYKADGNTYSIWYYAGSGGRLYKGWHEIDGVNYYFDPTDYFLVTSE